MGQDSYFDHLPVFDSHSIGLAFKKSLPPAPGRPGPRCEPGLQRSSVGQTTHLHCLEHPIAGSRDDRVVSNKEGNYRSDEQKLIVTCNLNYNPEVQICKMDTIVK